MLGLGMEASEVGSVKRKLQPAEDGMALVGSCAMATPAKIIGMKRRSFLSRYIALSLVETRCKLDVY